MFLFCQNKSVCLNFRACFYTISSYPRVCAPLPYVVEELFTTLVRMRVLKSSSATKLDKKHILYKISRRLYIWTFDAGT